MITRLTPFIIALVTLFGLTSAFADEKNLRSFCLQKVNDDTIRKIPITDAAVAYVSIRTDELKDFATIKKKMKEPISSDNPHLPMFPELTYYRCMSGLVFVCSKMVNGECNGAADIKLNRPDIVQYCRKNPNKDPSMAEIGHGSFYMWECLNGKAHPVMGNRVDQRNFVAEDWHPLVSEKALKEFLSRN